MKKIFVLLTFFVFAFSSLAFGEAEMQHIFYNQYNPQSSTWVYNQATPDSVYTNAYATGDQLAVNGYVLSALQVSSPNVNEYIQVQTLGRIAGGDYPNQANWVVLNTTEFGAASSPTQKNVLVDLSSYHVSFIKVGIHELGTYSSSTVDVVGNFTNDYK